MRSHLNFLPVPLCALSALMMLAGCATSDDGAPVLTVAAQPLQAPAELVAPCADPGVRAGQPALVELARNRQALAVCRDRHGQLVAFVHDVTEGRSGD